jgi:hypothetical protein
MPHGPNSYSREASDSYAIHQPGAAKAKTQYKVQVTVHWDFHRRTVTKEEVKFTSGVWLSAGKGPIDVYKPTTSGGRKKSGTISWAILTGFEHRVETNTSTKKFRNVYVPWVRLTRTFKPDSGGPSHTEELPQHPSGIATDKGSWQPIPA